MIIDNVDIFLQYTSYSAQYCREYIYHRTGAADAWTIMGMNYHDKQAIKFKKLFDEAFVHEYPMYKDFKFEPVILGGVPCCTVYYSIKTVVDHQLELF